MSLLPSRSSCCKRRCWQNSCRTEVSDRSLSWPGSDSSQCQVGSSGRGRSLHSTACRGKWWRCGHPGCQPRPCGEWTGWWCGLTEEQTHSAELITSCIRNNNDMTKSQLSVVFTLSVFKQQVPDAPASIGIDPSSRFIQDYNLGASNKSQGHWQLSLHPSYKDNG